MASIMGNDRPGALDTPIARCSSGAGFDDGEGGEDNSLLSKRGFESFSGLNNGEDSGLGIFDSDSASKRPRPEEEGVEIDLTQDDDGAGDEEEEDSLAALLAD